MGESEWYPGKVAAVKFSAEGSLLYDLTYDDGDKESNMVEAHVRLPPVTAQSKPAAESASASSITADGDYKVDEQIEAFFEDYGQWYRGKVKGISNATATAPLTYFIVYDDGDEEAKVLPARMRKFQKYAGSYDFCFNVGDEIEGRYKGGVAWYKAKVKGKHCSEDFGPVYELVYEDGDLEQSVKEINMRALPGATKPASTTVAAATAQARPAQSTDAYSSPRADTTSSASAAKATPASGGGGSARKGSQVVTTNLDSFLNDLSDDDEDVGLDAGRPVTLKSNGELMVNPNPNEEDYDDQFDA